jgi:transposase
MTVAVLGIDLAKRVFQLHGVDARGRPVVSKRVSRAKLAEAVVRLAPRVVAMEACCGAHYWGRRFRDLGVEVRLIHARFVRSLREERQERRAGRRGDLRGSAAPTHADNGLAREAFFDRGLGVKPLATSSLLTPRGHGSFRGRPEPPHHRLQWA